MKARPPAAYPRAAVVFAGGATLLRAAALGVIAAARGAVTLLQAAARTLDTLSAVADAGGTPPPPIPAVATDAPTLL